LNTTVEALAVSGGTLYAGGQFKNVRNTTVRVNGIAKWDGSSWTPLGTGMGGAAPYVRALAVLGSTLYAGGQFTTAGNVTNVHYIAQWDGNSWSPLGSGMDRAVNALAVTGSTLYVGGDFFTAGGKVSAYAAMASLGASVPIITQDTAFGFTNRVFGFNVAGPAGPV
jgi:hypothetical protein